MSRVQKPSLIQLKPGAAASSEPNSYRATPGGFRGGKSSPARPQEKPAAGINTPDLFPEEILDQLREFVEAGELSAARHLTEEASRLFPDHDEIQKARRVLGAAKATPNPFVQPTTAAEIAWLEDPPAEARGKWVALVGSELVGMAKSLADLMQQLEAKNL